MGEMNHGSDPIESVRRSRYTALFIDIRGTEVLVIEGGPVAIRECRYLADAKIRVIAKIVLPEIEDIADTVEYRCIDPEKYAFKCLLESVMSFDVHHQ